MGEGEQAGEGGGRRRCQEVERIFLRGWCTRQKNQSGPRQPLDSYRTALQGSQRDGESGVLPKSPFIHSCIHATNICRVPKMSQTSNWEVEGIAVNWTNKGSLTSWTSVLERKEDKKQRHKQNFQMPWNQWHRIRQWGLSRGSSLRFVCLFVLGWSQPITKITQPRWIHVLRATTHSRHSLNLSCNLHKKTLRWI